ncbi:MAG: type III-B CRISPR module RAMP protein Cmr6 [Chitinophagales bacterium]|nr:type III-B CRISPR module RAMP protein Cmr6 [Chitinophagales bacterium]MDW8420006.1 type III-B CRISPR module RAMP protein Cmr6 [Chitinophagales bacterium]
MSTWSQYTAPNAGLLFYKLIYKEATVKEKIKLSNGELFIDVQKDAKTSPFDPFYKELYKKSICQYQQIVNPAATHRFTLFTTYPGLLVGSGYPHDTKAKGDFKIGFYFDHTSGLPVIPGSSVKGVLRSAFEVDVTGNGKNYTGEKSVEFMKWLLTEINENDIAAALEVKVLKQIVQEIFGDEQTPGKDIFFDAVINIQITGDKPFLANDFITPHPNPFKNPVPIQFLKVLPGIGFEFRFLLNDSTWKSNVKERLFQKILLTLGIGAKTNVGYGQFVENNEPQATKPANQSGAAEAEQTFKTQIPPHIASELKKNKEFDGVVINENENDLLIEFNVNDNYCRVLKSKKRHQGVALHDKVKVKINADYRNDNNLNCKVIKIT